MAQSTSSPPLRSEDATRIFLFGAHVYRVQSTPLDVVLKDLRTMRDLGMNLVNIQESWSWENPREGVYDFSELDALVDEAGRLGMLASISFTLEQLPKWVWDKYPDCRLLNAYNQPHEDPTQYVMNFDGKPGPCWDHPGVVREAKAFIEALVAHFADRPHLAYWDLWQEIALWTQRPGLTKPEALMPFNPETLEHFRAWLRGKYGENVDGLNHAWRTRFGSWAEVDPPRANFSVPSFIDFSRFIYDGYLTRVVAWRTQVLHAADPRKLPTVLHTSSPYFGSTCEHRWSKAADWYGTSFYPTVQIDTSNARAAEANAAETSARAAGAGPLTDAFYRPEELWQSSFILNYSRCATLPRLGAAASDRRFMLFECAAGPYNYKLHARAPVTAADLRRWFLLQTAAGSQGCVLWNTRPEPF